MRGQRHDRIEYRARVIDPVAQVEVSRIASPVEIRCVRHGELTAI
jgi:hypothetical protein